MLKKFLNNFNFYLGYYFLFVDNWFFVMVSYCLGNFFNFIVNFLMFYLDFD